MTSKSQKISDLINSLDGSTPFYSFEFFPPKTKQGGENLRARIERMAKLNPLFVTVTWGAGGSTASKSLELAGFIQQQGINTCLHLTCTNMDKELIDKALDKCKALGIRNILALRGDPPRGEEYQQPNSSDKFAHAVDLVKYIRQNHGDYFCIGVAAYPEGHVDGSDISNQNPENDLPYLVEKVQAGADFIITQLFYDTEKFLKFEEMLLNHPSKLFENIPIIPGLMPISTYQSFARASRLSHASIPQELLESVEKVNNNDDLVKAFGVKVLCKIMETVHSKSDKRIRGFHFYTLNLERSVALIIENSSILNSNIPSSSPLDSTEESAVQEETDGTSLPSGPEPGQRRRRRSSLTMHNRVLVEQQKPTKESQLSVTYKEMAEAVVKPVSSRDILAISSGEGSLGREVNWDDFPNGRFGDSRSPAYGVIDGYGPTLHVDAGKIFTFWGYPKTKADITNLIIEHLTGELGALPWSDDALNPETGLIQEELIAMNKRGMWTVASQPACEGVYSGDKIFGWGPKGGFVFQKPFVEFFISPEDWEQLKQKLDKHISSRDSKASVSSYYACNHTLKLETNLPRNSSSAVTWGVFPNKEILQSTIIEEESFLVWAEEAFALWKEWKYAYSPNSETYKLLSNIHDSYYLVTLVYHDFKNPEGLWNLILN